MPQYAIFDSADIQSQFYQALEAGMENVWALPISYLNSGSDRATENYNWLGQVPQLSKWLGNRDISQLNKYALTVTNDVYQSSVDFDIEDFNRDKTGNIGRAIGGLASRTNTHWNSLIATLQNNGGGSTSGLAYDAQYFFDSDHNESGTNQINDCSSSQITTADVATAAAPTATEAANVISEVMGYFMTYTDDKGEPINQSINGLTIVTSKAAIYAAFLNASRLANLASGATNPVPAFGLNFNVILSPRTTAANTVHFYINDSTTYRPYILQEQGGVQVQELGPGSDLAVNYNKYRFGVKAVRGAAYGAWQKAMRVTLS